MHVAKEKEAIFHEKLSKLAESIYERRKRSWRKMRDGGTLSLLPGGNMTVREGCIAALIEARIEFEPWSDELKDTWSTITEDKVDSFLEMLDRMVEINNGGNRAG